VARIHCCPLGNKFTRNFRNVDEAGPFNVGATNVDGCKKKKGMKSMAKRK
jgi:hypothetical protein